MATLINRVEDDVLILYFRDVRVVDESRIQDLGNELVASINQAPKQKLLVNFRNLTYMSSSMIGKVMLLSNRCKEAGVKLRMCELSKNVLEVFQLMKLDGRLDIYGSEEDALKRF